MAEQQTDPGQAAPQQLALQQLQAANYYGNMPLESPLFLPIMPVEPSPTTGIQHLIPPLFQGNAGRQAVGGGHGAGIAGGGHQLPSPAAKPGKQSAANDDGWQWRKYGEKIVKGSPCPRSYYKCSQPNCGAKKIVERDNSTGAVTGTEYKGEHNHPMPGGRVMLGGGGVGGGARVQAMRPPKPPRMDAAAAAAAAAAATMYNLDFATQQQLMLMGGGMGMGMGNPLSPQAMQYQGYAMGMPDMQQMLNAAAAAAAGGGGGAAAAAGGQPGGGGLTGLEGLEGMMMAAAAVQGIKTEPDGGMSMQQAMMDQQQALQAVEAIRMQQQQQLM